jgi:structural maintenance of chromosome 4
MKPKAPTEHEDGLLEYLEDIIGTTKYKVPIEEANQSIDTLNEERSEKVNRLKIVEKDKNALEVSLFVFHDFSHFYNVAFFCSPRRRKQKNLFD